MKVVALCIILAFISLYYAAEYTADFRMTSSSIKGTLTGTFHYSLAQQRIRYSYVSGSYDVITSYDNSAGAQFFTFKRCSANKCDTSPNPTGLTQPLIERSSGDVSGTSTSVNGVACTRYGRGSGLSSICIGASNNVVQFVLSTGESVFLENHRGLVSGALTANTGWGCVFSCDVPLDIVLVADESGSISGGFNPNANPKYSGEWADVAGFMQKFTAQFKIEFNKVHMGIVKFGNGQIKVTPTMTYDSGTISSIVNGFARCTTSGCSDYTRIGNGILYGAEMLKSNIASRANVPKIIVLITDGVDNNGGTFSLGIPKISSTTTWVNDIAATASNSWAYFTKNVQGIKLITVSVGDGVNPTYLTNLASPGSSGKLYYSASTFPLLQTTSFIQSLGTAVCTATSTVSPCTGTCNGLCACGSCICPNNCDDANVCTSDSCTNGLFFSGCTNKDIICNDNNACTANTCNPSTGCQYPDISASCNDQNPCTDDTCVPATGCKYTPKNCTNPNPCYVNSVCSGGVCTPYTDICNDDNACTEEICTGPGNTPPCSFRPIDCTRGSKCIVSTCNRSFTGNNGCANTSVDCSDGNACTDDSCDPATGCINTAKNCNDNNACTDDTCLPATGCNNTYFNVTERCNTGDLCANYTCDPTLGCQSQPIRCDNTYNDSCILVFCDPFQGCAPFPKKCNYTGEKKIECINAFCDSTKQDSENCIFEETEECKLTVVLATTGAAVLGVGAIIGIIIGAVVCVGATTTVAVLGFNGAFSGEFENKNPLYEKETKEGKNPLYENKQG